MFGSIAFVDLRLRRNGFLHVNEQSFRIKVKRRQQPIKTLSTPPELPVVCVCVCVCEFVLQKFLLN